MMKIKSLKRLKSEKGFTLVEVIISILMLSIVTTMIFSFLDNGLSTYLYGVERIDEQGQLRLAVFKTTELTRNIFKVDIYDTNTSVPGDEFIYLNGDTLVYYDNGAETNLSAPILTDVTFSLSDSNDKYILHLTLISSEDTITTDILLNNISSSDVLVNVTSGSSASKVLEITTAP